MDVHEPPRAAPKPDTPQPSALLPPVLFGSTAILWLWVVPLLVLLLLNVQGYQLVEGNMNDGERGNAWLLGTAGLANLLAGCGLWWWIKRHAKRSASVFNPAAAGWGVFAVVVQGGYIWLTLSMAGDLLPETVTTWIYPPQRFFYNQVAFTMLPLFWGIVRLACARPVRARGKAFAVNLSTVIGAPLVLFLVFQVLDRINAWGQVSTVLVVSLVVLIGVLMFVGLVRVLALAFRNMGAWSGTAERVAIVVFALAMPVGGLLLNREIPFPVNFQAWEVYALTGVNAVVLLLASWMRARRPLLSLGLLCSTLPFTLYFFVVFLPFLPIAVVGVIAVGAGFLVLTPTILLILHLCLLNDARRGPRAPRLVVGTLCFLLLPGFFTVRGLADKAALNTALDHVYAPVVADAPVVYEGSRANLRRALANHRSYKNGIYYPLLSDYYAWLVFDHLVLPDDKLARLEKTFFGVAGSIEKRGPLASRNSDFWHGRPSSVRDRNRMPRTTPPPRTIRVDDLATRVVSQDERATVVTLALTLKNTGHSNAEYVKTLPLPPGVFVNGFRLHVNGEPVPGRITEKKTALWVYSMIRDTERRDPGLLFYNTPEELELRVFPVLPKTPGVVEIDFLVPAVISAEEATGLGATDDPAIVLTRLAETLRPRLAYDGHGRVVATGLDRLGLPAASRERYLHVIVDRSEDTGFDGDLSEIIGRLRAEFPEAADVRVTLANYEVMDVPPETSALDRLPRRGGFLPDVALARAIRFHRKNDLDSAAHGNDVPPQPVFVLLTGAEAATVSTLDTAKAWRDVVPAIELHVMGTNGMLTRQGEATETPLVRLGNSVRPVVAGRVVRFDGTTAEEPLLYWDVNTRSWREVGDVEPSAVEAPWARAAALHLMQQDHERSPGGAPVDLKALVEASRHSGVMIASTSYIVVENAAQWRMLERSEDKKLGQNSALDFKEAPSPAFGWLAAGFGLWLWMRRRFIARRRAKE